MDTITTPTPETKKYVVTLRFQYPAWDEKDGIPFYVEATSKSQAIERARREAYNAGHLCGGQGRVTFKAEEEVPS